MRWKRNIPKGHAQLDLNPGASEILGLEPPFLVPAEWAWADDVGMIGRLRELYHRYHAVRTPEQDIQLFLENPNAVIIRTPQYVVFAKEAVRWMSDDELRNPAVPLPAGTVADAWYIYCLVGSACNFLAFEPYALPYVGWHRRGRLRWYRTKPSKPNARSMTPFLIESFVAV